MGKEQFEEMDEEMTVELELDDGTNVTCAIITILEVPFRPVSKRPGIVGCICNRR